MKTLSKVTAFLIALIIGFSNMSNAQNKKAPLFPVPSKDAASEMLKRPLVIANREMDPKDAEKLKKKDPAQFDFQDNYNKYFNETMKFYFDKYFKGNKSIEMKSRSEVDKLVESKSSQYVVLIPMDDKMSFDVGGMTKHEETYALEMMLPDKKNEYMIIPLLNNILSDADFVFAISQINWHLEKITAGQPLPSYEYSNKNTATKIKNLKLAINLNALANKMTKEEVKEAYTLPMEFVDSLNDYENIITEMKQGYAYIAAFWCGALWGGAYAVVDAGTGEILAVLSAGGVHYSIGWMPDKEMVEKLHLTYTQRRALSFDVIRFKKKYEIKTQHIKRFDKLGKEGE